MDCVLSVLPWRSCELGSRRDRWLCTFFLRPVAGWLAAGASDRETRAPPGGPPTNYTDPVQKACSPNNSWIHIYQSKYKRARTKGHLLVLSVVSADRVPSSGSIPSFYSFCDCPLQGCIWLFGLVPCCMKNTFMENLCDLVILAIP